MNDDDIIKGVEEIIVPSFYKALFSLPDDDDGVKHALMNCFDPVATKVNDSIDSLSDEEYLKGALSVRETRITSEFPKLIIECDSETDALKLLYDIGTTCEEYSQLTSIFKRYRDNNEDVSDDVKNFKKVCGLRYGIIG